MHTANSIPLKPVASSALAAIGHDPATETLAVQMFQGAKPGNVYHYANVTLIEYSAMASAKSLGEYLALHIKAHKEKHPCTNMGMPAIELPPVKLSKELLAGLLTGREYGKEMLKEEEMQAKTAGLIVIFSANDDLMELRGAIIAEFNCYDGGTAHIDAKGLLPDRENVVDDDELKDLFARQPAAHSIEALWSAEEGYSWTYRTDVPHATFEIVEDGEAYCRGIVIDVADLGGAA
ncbi:KTSC domain-containing protein [Janthinobacterium sp. ROICE36]|uniref:KTSC domain-containing protein n=1 Tax=Janthinobacterium sp. ROICE36 TaxID=2048670 RepID=UPI001C63FA6C|nr:KTSC domain-containing protein [Janthinobacterium sp. ROICE36]